MRIGYARVSTDDQNLALQLDALRQADCKKVYEDRLNGARAARPGLARALEVGARAMCSWCGGSTAWAVRSKTSSSSSGSWRPAA